MKVVAYTAPRTGIGVVKVLIDEPQELVARRRAQYYKTKAALREANADGDTEAVAALQAQLDGLTGSE